MTDETHEPTSVVCFANARLPDSDYRVAFALASERCRVTLALPERPDALPEEMFERIRIGPGLTPGAILRMLLIPAILRRREASIALFFATQFATFGPLMSRLVGCAPVITITGLGRAFAIDNRRTRLTRTLYLLGFKFNARIARAVLFQNQDDMDRLTSHLPAALRGRCELIGSGIDMTYFEPGPAAGVERGNRVLMVARLLPEKGVRDFLRLADELHDLAEFIMIGPASEHHTELREDVLAAHQSGLISYAGQMTSADVRRELRRCPVLVLPSKSEGLPRIALEAAASGAAVVAYDIPGCQAALGPEHPFVSLGNLDGLINEVRTLLEDPVERQRRTDHALDFVTRHRSSAAYVERLEAILL